MPIHLILALGSIYRYFLISPSIDSGVATDPYLPRNKLAHSASEEMQAKCFSPGLENFSAYLFTTLPSLSIRIFLPYMTNVSLRG